MLSERYGSHVAYQIRCRELGLTLHGLRSRYVAMHEQVWLWPRENVSDDGVVAWLSEGPIPLFNILVDMLVVKSQFNLAG